MLSGRELRGVDNDNDNDNDDDNDNEGCSRDVLGMF